MEFVLLQWNCRSLIPHQAELKHYLAEVKVKPAVICLQETWLNASKRITIPGYNIIRKDRDGAPGRGVATLIIEGLSYTVIDTPQDVEALSVQFKSTSNRVITVTNIYHPSLSAIDVVPFRKLFEVWDSIIVGDLNSFSSL